MKDRDARGDIECLKMDYRRLQDVYYELRSRLEQAEEALRNLGLVKRPPQPEKWVMKETGR